jgi:hypothetical protein
MRQGSLPRQGVHLHNAGKSYCPNDAAFGSKADIQTSEACPLYPKSGHVRCSSLCLLWANSGHHAVYSGVGNVRITEALRVIAMSALRPKADMCSAPPNVRFGPIADMATSCAGFFADPNTAAEFAADY